MPVWGVVAEVEMDDPPRHVLEEVGRRGRGRRRGGRERALQPRTASGQVSLGSTFLAERARRRAPGRRGSARRASASCRGCGGRKVVGARACARPQSLDGRPLVGELPGAGRAVGRRRPRAVGHLDGSRHGAHRGGRAPRAAPRCRRRCRCRASSRLLAGCGSGRTITVSATSLISSAPRPDRPACAADRLRALGLVDAEVPSAAVLLLRGRSYRIQRTPEPRLVAPSSVERCAAGLELLAGLPAAAPANSVELHMASPFVGWLLRP